MLAVEVFHELTTPLLRNILEFNMDGSMLGMYVVADFMIENIPLHNVAQNWNPPKPRDT